jgi:hypothetical protein
MAQRGLAWGNAHARPAPVESGDLEEHVTASNWEFLSITMPRLSTFSRRHHLSFLRPLEPDISRACPLTYFAAPCYFEALIFLHLILPLHLVEFLADDIKPLRLCLWIPTEGFVPQHPMDSLICGDLSAPPPLDYCDWLVCDSGNNFPARLLLLRSPSKLLGLSSGIPSFLNRPDFGVFSHFGPRMST